jgi:ABC-2 type transport system permease protein
VSVTFRSGPAAVAGTTIATALAYLRRSSAYTIQVVRLPVGPLLLFATWRITYGMSGRHEVDGATLSGFLLVGIFGTIIWSSSLWSSGSALENERWEGTSGSLFLTPASRAAVVAGHGFGSVVWLLPSFLVILALTWLTGARFDVTDPLAVGAAVLALIVASLAAGFTFSGLFILSRRGNLIANVLQPSAYLLSGMLIPVSALPVWLRPLADGIPVTHALIALRATTLLGAGWGAGREDILSSLAASAVWYLVGLYGLRRVEGVAKRTGQLDLY